MAKVFKEDSSAKGSNELEDINEEISNISKETSEDLLLARKPGKIEKPKKRLNRWIILLIILLSIACAAGCAYLYYRHMVNKGKDELLGNKAMIKPHNSTVSEDGKTVEYEGIRYKRNDNIVSFLIMGIDDIDGSNDEKEVGNKGQADTIFYGTLDVSDGTLKLLNISRDSIADVDLYDEDGEYVRTEKEQICLAYAYGTDDRRSCENVKKSAERLLFNAPVDFYVSIDFPAVSVLTDSIGGVNVNILDDLSSKDAALKKGENVTLNGKQAMIYVRSRDFETLDSNNARMLRQKQFVTQFLSKLRSTVKQKPYAVMNIYQMLEEYMTTDLNLPKALYLASYGLKNPINSNIIKTVKGEVVKEGEYAQYIVDEDDLYNSLLDMLYIREGGKARHETESETDINEEPEKETEESLVKVDFSYMY